MAIIKNELGKPSELFNLDGKTRNLRFDAMAYRLRNFGVLEIAIAFKTYYFDTWYDDDADWAGAYTRPLLSSTSAVLALVRFCVQSVKSNDPSISLHLLQPLKESHKTCLR